MLQPSPSFLRAESGTAPEPVDSGWLARHPNGLVLALVAVVTSAVVGVAVATKPAVGIVVVAGVAVGLLVLRRPAVGGYLLVGVVPITAGLRTGWPVPVFRLSELLIGTVGVAILLTATPRQAVRWRVVDSLVLAYSLLAVALGGYDVLRDHDALSTSLVGTLFGPMQFVLLYRATAVALPHRRQRAMALRVLLLGSIPVSIIALLQQLKLNGINRFIANITGSQVFGTRAYAVFARATGPFNHWTPLAGYLLVILLLGISLALHDVRDVLSRRALFGVLGLAAVGLLLSAELSAMIALVGGSLALGVWAKRLRFLLRWGIVVLAILATAFGSYFNQRLGTQFYSQAGSGRSTLVPQTIQYRFQIWGQQYLPAIDQKLMTGYGPVLPASITWPDTESQYITYLMWGGIPLLVAFVVMMWALFARVRSLSRPEGDDPAVWAVARTLAVLIVALYAIDAIFPYFSSAGLPQPFWALVGVLFATGRGLRPVGDTAVTRPPERLPALA